MHHKETYNYVNLVKAANCSPPAGPVTCIEFSKDGRYVCTGHETGRIFLWKSAQLKPVNTVKVGHEGAVLGIVLGKHFMVSIGDDRVLKLWQIGVTGIVCRQSMSSSHDGGVRVVRSALWGSNGHERFFGTGDSFGNIKLWVLRESSTALGSGGGQRPSVNIVGDNSSWDVDSPEGGSESKQPQQPQQTREQHHTTRCGSVEHAEQAFRRSLARGLAGKPRSDATDPSLPSLPWCASPTVKQGGANNAGRSAYVDDLTRSVRSCAARFTDVQPDLWQAEVQCLHAENEAHNSGGLGTPVTDMNFHATLKTVVTASNDCIVWGVTENNQMHRMLMLGQKQLAIRSPVVQAIFQPPVAGVLVRLLVATRSCLILWETRNGETLANNMRSDVALQESFDTMHFAARVPLVKGKKYQGKQGKQGNGGGGGGGGGPGGYGGHGEEASEMPLTNLCFSPSGEFVLGVSSQQHRQCELHMWGVHKLERSNAEGLPEPDLTYEIID
jgi:WD40 repeat protein